MIADMAKAKSKNGAMCNSLGRVFGEKVYLPSVTLTNISATISL
jgi:hypothetical protein